MVIVCSIYAANFKEMMGTADDLGDQIYTKWYRVAVIVAVISTAHVLIACTLFYGICKVTTVH